MSVEKKVKICNKTGLHARPASQFVQEAGKFNSVINIIVDDKEINAKSILGVLSLGLSQGTEIILKAEGSDETAAINDLVDFIENKLPKEEG